VLAPGGTATIGLTGQVATLADAYAWQRQLEQIPDVAEVIMKQATLVDGNAQLVYNVNATITLSGEAYSGRFLPQLESEEDE